MLCIAALFGYILRPDGAHAESAMSLLPFLLKHCVHFRSIHLPSHHHALCGTCFASIIYITLISTTYPKPRNRVHMIKALE
jgi:hypothetical protein